MTRFQRLAGDALAIRSWLAHGDEPLVGEHRFDDDAGAVATRHLQLVRLDAVEQALGFEVGDDLLARVEAVQAAIFFRSVFVDAGIEREDADRREAVCAGRPA
jgi:hypothetical protein